MKFNISFLLFLVLLIVSCSKEDEPEMLFADGTDSTHFVGKIIPHDNGYWLIIRDTPSESLSYFSNSINFIDGLTYFTDNKTVTKNGIGYIYDAELYSDALATLTSKQILSFNKNLQSNVLKNASTNETYKLMDKDADGKVWVLSNKSIFSLSGDVIAFPNNIQAIDFEVASDKSFWIASSDTVYQVKMLGNFKIPISQITGPVTSAPTIYSLKIDKNNNIWVNTSVKLFKFDERNWNDIKVGSFTVDNFKTIPFMDIDSKGNLWLAEKNYQSFTNLHFYNGSSWTSYKLEPQIATWINDIETTETGTIWIASSSGLQKLKIN